MRADIREELRAFREQSGAANDAVKHQPVEINGDGHTIIFAHTVCAETMHFTAPQASGDRPGSGLAEVRSA